QVGVGECDLLLELDPPILEKKRRTSIRRTFLSLLMSATHTHIHTHTHTHTHTQTHTHTHTNTDPRTAPAAPTSDHSVDFAEPTFWVFHVRGGTGRKGGMGWREEWDGGRDGGGEGRVGGRNGMEGRDGMEGWDGGRN